MNLDPRVYDAATSAYAGSGGTDAQCNAVLDALGVVPGNLAFTATTCGVADECILASAAGDTQRARCLDTPENPDAFNGIHQRACACGL